MQSLICAIKRAGHGRPRVRRGRRERALVILGRAQAATLGLLVLLAVAGTGGTQPSQPGSLRLADATACPSQPAPVPTPTPTPTPTSTPSPTDTGADSGTDSGTTSLLMPASAARSLTASGAVTIGSRADDTPQPTATATGDPGDSPSDSTPAPTDTPSTGDSSDPGSTSPIGTQPVGQGGDSGTGDTGGGGSGTGDSGTGDSGTGDTPGGPTSTAPEPQLCVSVASFVSSTVLPGGTASFAIWVWTMNAPATGVTITASVASAASAAAAPTFALCPDPNGQKTSCTIDNLPLGNGQEVVAGSAVALDAGVGTKITLTASVQADGAIGGKAAATITVTSAVTGTSTSIPTFPSPEIPVELPGLPSFSLPGGTLPEGSFTSPTNPTGLFPTVSPSTSKSKDRAKAHGATTDSAILPLDPRLIGWQLAGLAVLVSAIVIAVIRLSLRRQPQETTPQSS